MQDSGKALARHFSNRSRSAKKIGSRLVIPRTLDDLGNPLTDDEIGQRRWVWDFSLQEARFLKALQEKDGNVEGACRETGSDPEWAKRFLQRKCAVQFLTESGHAAALAQIADATWVKGKYVEAALKESSPDDTQKWAIDRLKEIVLPKQLASLSIQQNIFNIPKMSLETEQALRILADKEADIVEAKVA